MSGPLLDAEGKPRRDIVVVDESNRVIQLGGTLCSLVADGYQSGKDKVPSIVRALMLAAFCCLTMVGCLDPARLIVKPDGKKNVQPIVTHEFRCLILEDLSARATLPSQQLSMLTSKNLKDFLKANCVKDSDNNPQYRIGIDGTPDGVGHLSGVWKTMADANPPKSLPWIILTNGSNTLAKPVETTWEPQFKADLEKYAGVTE